MNGLVIDQLDDDVWAGLRQLAADRGRTVPEEARDILRRATAAAVGAGDASTGDGPGLGTQLVANFAGLGTDFEIPELRGQIHPRVPDFDSSEFDP